MLRPPKVTSIVKLFLTIAAVLVLSCTDYNPYTDDSNANFVVLAKSFTSGDTISIFSTQTLTYIITVPKLIDSIVVNAVGNRLFPNNARKIDPLSDENNINGKHVLSFTFSDTGYKTIEIMTYRSDGEVLSHVEHLVVKCPLAQGTINGAFNVDLHLYTPPVPDRVNYVWDFPDTIIKSSSNSIGVKLLNAGKMGRGWLYVTNGLFESQKIPFQFILVDTIRPVIWIANSETIVKDTIITGNVEFPLRVLITDIGNNGHLSARVDSDTFDIERDSLHIKIFSRLDTLKSPLGVVVTAKDNSVRVNTAEKKIWIKYDPSKANSGTFSLVTLIPSKDTIISSTSTRTLYGLIEKYTKDTLPVILTFFVNNEKYSDTIKTEDWYRTIPLLEGMQQVTIVAQKGAESYTSKRWINYNPLFSDTAKPVIMDIKVKDSRENKYVSKNAATLNVIAFCDGSTVDTLTCNGKLFRSDGSGYNWTVDNIGLEHSLRGNNLKIVAKTKNNSVSENVAVFYNRRPVIITGPQFPCPVIAGKTYATKIAFEDGDANDTAIFKLRMDDTSDNSMHLDNNGNLTWIPVVNVPKTRKKFSIRIFDGYEYIDSTFEATVADTGQVFENVKFGKVLEQFPGFLEVNKDTMRINLLPEKGTPVYTYQVDIQGTGRSLPVVNNTLSWCPSTSDLGIVRMRIVATDYLFKTDTLYPVITVVQKNRPLTLRCEKITDTLVTGAFNLRDTSKTILLRFSIDDPDQDIAEKFSAYVTQGGVIDTIDLEKTRLFTVSVNSSLYKHGTDTLRVRVTDRVGHSDQFQRAVDYGVEPQTPLLVSPHNDTTIGTNHVVLKWKANNDPSIRYELYLGLKNKEMKYIYGGTDTSFVFEKLDTTGIYFWQVFSSNGKEKKSSPLWTFNLNYSELVKIETTEKEFKNYYVFDRDTIYVPLRLVYSNPNVQFIAFYQKDSVPLQIINSILQSTPRSKDSGWQRIEIIAKDTLHFVSDTLFADVFITATNLKVRLQVENKLLNSDTLDLRKALETDTIVFTVETDIQDLNEDYTIEISQRNTIRTFYLDTANTFMMVVEPGAHGLVSDIIEVKIIGTTLGSDSKKITVMYNTTLSEGVNSKTIVDIIGAVVKDPLQ